MAGVFSKMSKVSLTLQGKQLTTFVAIDQIWAFKQIQEFWENYTCLCELDDFPHLKIF